MAWTTEMVVYVRYMVGDVDPASYIYTDQRLLELIVVAAQLVIQELDFTQNFIPDINTITIMPDPTDRVGLTRDDSFINLVCMKAACILDRSEARTAAGQAVQVTDGGTTVNMRAASEAKLKLLQFGGWCPAYELAKEQYALGKSHIAGAAIMTPFRVWAGDGRSIWPSLGYSDYR